MTTISIIGAGWLGTPLATTLLSKHYRVYASNTSHEKAQALNQFGIHGFCCDLTKPHNLAHDLVKQQTDVVIGCFPPGFRRGLTQEYQVMWKQITEAATRAKVKKIIMISSSAVYPTVSQQQESSDSGTSNLIMDESKASWALASQRDEGNNYLSFSDNAKVMLNAEQHVIDSGTEFVIIRLSGLIGPNRHPARFVSKLKQVSSSAPANMLHLDDAVGSITFATQNLKNQVINVTTPDTLSKDKFYQLALHCASLPSSQLPQVIDIPDKKIDTSKLLSLGYQYKHPTLSQALESIHD
ncbi:NAD(P)H-binding protein [Vibrio lamellibrachiae]|uniref:NAD-dependent epimerase/dehydratase family protein n=1 Tax=Vibrio lamellibrachiae TaxID=2910253 RepID=UPI003D0A08AA